MTITREEWRDKLVDEFIDVDLAHPELNDADLWLEARRETTKKYGPEPTE